MGRLRRFESHRFVATRDDMIFYDCDDPEQLESLSSRVTTEELLDRNVLAAFAPDTEAEARNRGYRPASKGQVQEV